MKIRFMLVVIVLMALVGEGMVAQTDADLTETYQAGAFSVRHPAGWVATTDDFATEVTFYSDEAAVEVLSGESNRPLLNMPQMWQLVNFTVLVEAGAVETVNVYDYLGFFADELGDQFQIGDSQKRSVSGLEGIVVPATFTIGRGARLEGVGSVYILREAEGPVVIATGLNFGGDPFPEGLLEAMIDSVVIGDGGDGLQLPEEFVGDGVSFNYPEGWVVFESDGDLILANSQEVAEAIATDAPTLPDGDVMGILFGSFPTEGMFTAAEVFDLFAAESGGADDLIIGERSEEMVIGGFNGVRAPVEVPPSAVDDGGIGTAFFVDYDDANVLLAIGFVTGDDTSMLDAVMEGVIATVRLGDDAVTGVDNLDFTFTQSYDANGIAFTYPEGWVLVDAGGQLALANNQEAADSLATGGTPPEGAVAILVIPFPTQGFFDAAGVLDIFAGEAAPDDTLQIGEEREEIVIADYTTFVAPITIPESEDGPGGEGALYVVQYSETTVFVAVGVATGDAADQIAPVVENMFNTLEVDEEALTLPGG